MDCLAARRYRNDLNQGNAGCNSFGSNLSNLSRPYLPNVLQSLRAMDTMYNGHFRKWVCDEANLANSAPILARIANEGHSIPRIVNALRWLTTHWPIRSTALLLRHITAAWAKDCCCSEPQCPAWVSPTEFSPPTPSHVHLSTATSVSIPTTTASQPATGLSNSAATHTSAPNLNTRSVDSTNLNSTCQTAPTPAIRPAPSLDSSATLLHLHHTTNEPVAAQTSRYSSSYRLCFHNNTYQQQPPHIWPSLVTPLAQRRPVKQPQHSFRSASTRKTTKAAILVQELTVVWEPHAVADLVACLLDEWPCLSQRRLFLTTLTNSWDFGRLSYFLISLGDRTKLEHKTKILLLRDSAEKDRWLGSSSSSFSHPPPSTSPSTRPFKRPFTPPSVSTEILVRSLCPESIRSATSSRTNSNPLRGQSLLVLAQSSTANSSFGRETGLGADSLGSLHSPAEGSSTLSDGDCPGRVSTAVHQEHLTNCGTRPNMYHGCRDTTGSSPSTHGLHLPDIDLKTLDATPMDRNDEMDVDQPYLY
ncbi:hypothetical protein QVD99_000427 [Batrachochytrium dendrobatidis]|uniref:Uncharacterized protein n=1 Tax=Batrachochytrium dendrobatidis (strain JEL423) TaxID=403673 RepID=A0A177WHE5_BATDL|nr:hypothetical protein O5D80_008002 [Batrachochytrium dendrobatidis]KAK5672945.1 hypothetical protein QVD99_000427 [Batrachochytrium dendrobatidis]OAJ38920.1 hypothetical protein BDEG_22811 [Batrachochytrium dendrobatidis JEL423]